MIAYLSRKRFNVIDAIGVVWIALAWRDENWLAVTVIAFALFLFSVMTEREGRGEVS